MDHYTAENYSTLKNSSGPKWWVWAAIVVGACCCISIAGFVGAIAYFGREPEGLSVQYEMPSVVQKGENFDLSIKATNSGSQSVIITSIDLDEAFGGSILDGSQVLETEPLMERDYSLEGIKTFHCSETIQPGETKTFTFHLQATTVGEYGGSIGVYVGDISKRLDYVGIIVQE
jgi:hypothetical protein